MYKDPSLPPRPLVGRRAEPSATPLGGRTYQGVRQSVRHPDGVAGSLAMPDPRVFGATPLDLGLKSGHPCRGASLPTLHNQLIDFRTTQMRHPGISPEAYRKAMIKSVSL